MEYATPKSQSSYVSKATNSSTSARQQFAPTVDPTLNQPASSNMFNVFNVQLNYNPNQALDPNSWDRSFHVVSLHGLMEHLASDALNIKESLSGMRKYILDKSIKSDKANDIENFKGMGKTMWEFISAIYELH